MRSRLQFGRIAVVTALLFSTGVRLPGQSDSEEELKCATLLAFVQNAHWKDPLPANSPLTVGFVGRKSLLRWLRTGVEGRLVEGHPVHVLDNASLLDPHCCQVLYFATDKPEEITPFLQSFYAAHVLTVGESDRFLDLGGAVKLFLLDGHMAFEVSLGSLDRAGIEISSRLLRFGQIRELPKGKRR